VSVRPATTVRRRTLAARVGLVLAALLAVLQLLTFVPQFADEVVLPAVFTALNVLALVLVPLAWRGTRWVRGVVIAVTLASALSATPAFFIPDLPVAAVVAASVGIVLAVLVTVLILVGPGRTRDAHEHAPSTA
jgi:hypothetical protein